MVPTGETASAAFSCGFSIANILGMGDFMNQLLMAVMTVGAVLGGLDRLFKNRVGKYRGNHDSRIAADQAVNSKFL